MEVTVPPDLIRFITAKSSRKESTKFISKLGALAKWVLLSPKHEELVGLRYIDPNTIEIKKSTISTIFQKQPGTLNTNLKESGFKKKKQNGEWTQYIREEPFHLENVEPQQENKEYINVSIKLPQSAQIVIPAKDSNFNTNLNKIWLNILDHEVVQLYPIEIFLSNAADLFGIKYIPKWVIFQLLSKVVFCSLPGYITMNDFSNVLSNFGENTNIMPKLIDLVQSSQNHDDWFTFEFTNQFEVIPNPQCKTVEGYFLKDSFFGFIVKAANGKTMKLRNDYSYPFCSEYLINDSESRFNSWESVYAYMSDFNT